MSNNDPLQTRVYNLARAPENLRWIGERFRAFMLEAAGRREWEQQEKQARQMLRKAGRAIVNESRVISFWRVFRLSWAKPRLTDLERAPGKDWERLGIFLDPRDLGRDKSNYVEGWFPPGSGQADAFLRGLPEAKRLWPGPNPSLPAKVTLLLAFHDLCSRHDKLLALLVAAAKDHDSAWWASACAVAWCRAAAKGDAERLDALERYLKDVGAVLGVAARPAKLIRAGEKPNDLPPEARAVAVLIDHPDWTDTAIAQKAGVNRTSLYRMPKYRGARDLLRKSRDDMPHGWKDGKTGEIEAFDDGVDE